MKIACRGSLAQAGRPCERVFDEPQAAAVHERRCPIYTTRVSEVIRAKRLRGAQASAPHCAASPSQLAVVEPDTLPSDAAAEALSARSPSVGDLARVPSPRPASPLFSAEPDEVCRCPTCSLRGRQAEFYGARTMRIPLTARFRRWRTLLRCARSDVDAVTRSTVTKTTSARAAYASFKYFYATRCAQMSLLLLPVSVFVQLDRQGHAHAAYRRRSWPRACPIRCCGAGAGVERRSGCECAVIS